MKEKYKEAVKKARNIIRDGVNKEKSSSYIKDQIYFMLESQNVGIGNIDHFDRYYFKPLAGKRISTYIKKQQMELAMSEFEKNPNIYLRRKDNYKNVSNFMDKYFMVKEGKKLKKFLVTEIYKMDDLQWISDQDTNNNMIIIESTTKEEAIRKYLYANFEFESQGILRNVLFHDFWVAVAYGEYEYIETFSNAELIMKIAETIYTKYLKDDDSDPEDSILKYDLEEISNEFFSLLNNKDKKEAYYYCNRYDVFCIELETLSACKKRKRKNLKNIINDIEDVDVTFWNLILQMIRDEKKTSYYLDDKILIKYGLDLEQANEMLRYCWSHKLKGSVSMDYEDGSFIACSLYSSLKFPNISKLEDDNDESQNTYVEIFPTEIVYKFAESGYDFKDGKNDIAIKILNDEK